MRKLMIGGISLGLVAVALVAAAAYSSHSSSAIDGVVYWRAYHERQAVVRDSLVDPDSAKFRGLYFSKVHGLQYMCGFVNARNSMGGYTGYRPFYAATAYSVIADGDVTEVNAWTLDDMKGKCSGAVE